MGKSSLLRYFSDGKFAEVSDPTVGVDFFARLVSVKGGARVKVRDGRELRRVQIFPPCPVTTVGHSGSGEVQVHHQVLLQELCGGSAGV